MKKIGIVTMYKNNNYGSCLQCLATIKILNEYGYDAVVINRVDKRIVKQTIRFIRKLQFFCRIILNPEKWNQYRLSIAESKRGFNDISINSKNSISNFIKKYIPEEYFTYRELKRKASSDDFFAFISGSDQIWNVSAPYLNPMLYLEFSPKYKRIAFSPSFGIDRIPEYEKKGLAKRLKEYPYLSNREDIGENIIKELTGRDSTVIIDPTLLIDKKKWIEFSKESIKIENKYVLLYFLNTPSKLAIKILKKLKLFLKVELIVLPYDFDVYKGLENYRFYSVGPKEFVELVNKAEFIITDSFHGVAFSINLNRQFFVFERNYGQKIKQNGRILSLLKKCGLESRFLEKDLNIEEVKPINYERINAVLNKERRKANRYLLDALNSIEKENKGR
ncbi:MAG: polysaccharide pyruvyl transferase family protein [Pleomorphochaeta sp.]